MTLRNDRTDENAIEYVANIVEELVSFNPFGKV